MTTMKDFHEFSNVCNRQYVNWFLDQWGDRNAIIELPQGIVYAWLSYTNGYTRLTFVKNGRSYSRSWVKAWGKRTVVRLAKALVADVCGDTENLSEDIAFLQEALEKLNSLDPTVREYGLEMIRDEIDHLKEIVNA